MARKPGDGEARVYAAAERFVSQGLRRDDSLFTPGRPIWTSRVAADLNERFVQRPDTSADTFEAKFARQLAGAPADTIQLAGELLYVHFLITMQLRGETKRSIIQTVLSWSPAPVSIPPDLQNALDKGLCNAGRSFLQHRPFLLMFLVEFVIRWKQLSETERDAMLSDPWLFKTFVFSVPARAARIQQHALLHLVHPDTFEDIVSESHKRKIVERFGDAGAPGRDLDQELIPIRQRLSDEVGAGFSFYRDPVVARWRPPDDEAAEPETETAATTSRGRRYWVEKTLVAGRPDRASGEWALGKAIWSPQFGDGGRDIYRLMREVRRDDVVLHFIDNKRLAGVSRVASDADTSSTPPPGTAWSDRPSIRFELTDFVPLQPSVDREDLFVDPEGRARVQEILRGHRGLFFNRDLELNQGSYLTEAPPVLLKLLDDIYRRKSGQGLPHVEFSGVLPEAAPPLEGPPRHPLTLEWLQEQTLWPQERLLEVIEALQSESPQVILAGPPGTGKTWVAQLLARYITQDEVTHHRLVQFHPSYSYEAFVEGLRPVVENGAIRFQRVPGVVMEIAESLNGAEHPFVLVIDEMNRANLPKVLGELMYLLEYRNHRIHLPLTKNFQLPPNLRFIATMNTADRSIRSIDVALRRRFDIFECPPDAEVLTRYFSNHENRVASLIDGFRRLNDDLQTQLDRHHTIGHTFFMMSPMTPDALLRVWRRKLAPLIEEYFFDQPDLVKSFEPGNYWPELQE